MLLSELLKNIEVFSSFKDAYIGGIFINSDEVKPGGLFVCLKGEKTDSHEYALQAQKNGAAAVIAQRDTDADNTVIVADTYEALALVSSAFYSHPSERLKIIGVTGTNGKTSVTHMIKSILEHCGRRTGLIGTVKNMSGSDVIGGQGLTTPEPPELHAMLFKMAESGCEYCVMEVSSQALAQKRCYGITFETAVFTNFTQDHLDYHKTMENYAKAKQILFSQCRKGIFNKDDPAYSFMAEKCPQSFFYSLKDKSCDFYAQNPSYDIHGSAFRVCHAGGEFDVKVGIPGIFSVYNAIAAAACAALEGTDGSDISKALAAMKPVPGRCEVMNTGTPFSVIIDYAHSPDSIENILRCVRSFTKGRVVALFGCGGDRDTLKRPLMAAAAARGADYVIITSDNPRTENPNRIIEDILPGISRKNVPCAVIPDRTHAIEFALKNAQAGDSIVLCGKGHETYQIIGSRKFSYDEREIVNRAIKKMI